MACQFLTIIPIRKKIKIEDGDLARSMAYFPIVGLALGMILVVSNKVLSRYMSYNLSDILLLVLLVFLTGGLHLDGLADSMDAVAGSWNKEEALKIMKEGRIGAIGAVSLILLLIVKYQALRALPPDIKNQAILLMPIVGRWTMVHAAYIGGYARKEGGIGKAFVDSVGGRELLAATMATILLVLFFLKINGMYIMPLLVLVLTITFSYLKRRLGGMTGDTLGALCEIMEASFLVAITIFYPRGIEI